MLFINKTYIGDYVHIKQMYDIGLLDKYFEEIGIYENKNF